MSYVFSVIQFYSVEGLLVCIYSVHISHHSLVAMVTPLLVYLFQLCSINYIV